MYNNIEMENKFQKKNIDKNMNYTLLEFIEKYNLDYELVGWYLDDKGKKKLARTSPSDKTKSESELVKYFQEVIYKINSKFNIAYFINIKETPFANIDIDENIDIETLHKKYPFSKNTIVLKGNTKGYHILVQNEDFINCKKQIDCLKHFEGDIITDTLMETIDKPIYNCDVVNVTSEEIKKIANFKFDKVIKKDKTEKIEKSETSNQINLVANFDGNYEQLEEIVLNIPVKYSNNYLDWIKIISILKKYNFYDLAKSFSKKGKDYIDEKFEQDYKHTASFTDYNIGTLYHYSKENKTQYEKIINKYKKLEKDKLIKSQLDLSQKEYEKLEEDFNETHFKVINKCLYFTEDKLENKILSHTPDKFKNINSHLNYQEIDKNGDSVNASFINKYMGHNGKPRMYKDIDVFPNNDKCPSDYYNLWTPFAIESIKEYDEDKTGLDFILNHIKILCNHQLEVYEYVLDFLAHMFQYPEEKPGKFILFISAQGTGKGLFFELLTQILGNDKVFETSQAERDVFGSHNVGMLNSYLVNLEEINFLSTKGNEGVFKNIVTQQKMYVNPKGKDLIEIKSYHRFMGSCNPEDGDIPIKSCKGDRRNLLIRCSDETKGNVEYFNELKKLVYSKNLQKTFYEFLINRKNVDVFISKPIPETEYQKDIQDTCEDYTLQFLKDYIYNDSNYGIKTYKGLEIFNKFKEFMEINNFNVNITSTRFGLKLKMLGFKSIIKKRGSRGIIYEVNGFELCTDLKITDCPLYLNENSDSD
jgi:hypothetical protein